jgi:hypothetical protein
MPQLVTQADLARRWGVSTARVAQLTTKDGFPEAKQRVGARDQALYSLSECDAWREKRMKAWRAEIAA